MFFKKNKLTKTLLDVENTIGKEFTTVDIDGDNIVFELENVHMFTRYSKNIPFVNKTHETFTEDEYNTIVRASKTAKKLHQDAMSKLKIVQNIFQTKYAAGSATDSHLQIQAQMPDKKSVIINYNNYGDSRGYVLSNKIIREETEIGKNGIEITKTISCKSQYDSRDENDVLTDLYQTMKEVIS